MTLAFATDKTNKAAKEALFAHRTVVWWKNTLMGRPAELNLLLQSSLEVEKSVWSGSNLRVFLKNHSDARFQLRNRSEYLIRRHGPVIEVAPNDTTVLEMRFAERPDRITLPFDVMNALVAPDKPGRIEFDIGV